MPNFRKIASLSSLIFFFSFPSFVFSAQVVVKKEKGAWTLLVDNQPYFIKGVGCNTATGEKGEDYLRLAKEMGANTVRTWGITPRSYFDQAEKYGLKVSAGVWFNPIRKGMSDSYKNKEYCRTLQQQTLQHVRELKNHPALLFWNLGNEVFAFTEDPKERKAFGIFLENLIQAVHKEDPLHPIVYAAAATRDLPDLKTFVPSLDIVGVNVYGSFNQVLGWMASEKYDRPVVATEFGPYGEWDGMKDANGQPFDPTDHIKAANYVSLWREIEKVTGKSLGGFAFVLGEQRNQASLTWYNINLGEKKRQSYWALTQAYTGQALKNRCPKIRFMKADRVNHLKPGDFINIELTASDPDGDKTTTKYFITDIATDPLIVQPARTYPTQTEIRSDGKAMMQVPHEPGIYRAYATVEDPEGFIAVANVSLKVEGITDSSH